MATVTNSSATDNHTGEKIAEQAKVSPKTVRNAEKFANAVDTIAENVGINPQKILSGEINASRRDIENISKYKPAFQKRVFEKVGKKESKNIKDAVKDVKNEEFDELKTIARLKPVENAPEYELLTESMWFDVAYYAAQDLPK